MTGGWVRAPSVSPPRSPPPTPVAASCSSPIWVARCSAPGRYLPTSTRGQRDNRSNSWTHPLSREPLRQRSPPAPDSTSPPSRPPPKRLAMSESSEDQRVAPAERTVMLGRHLHARPAGQVAQLAAKHQTTAIELGAGDRKANARTGLAVRSL